MAKCKLCKADISDGTDYCKKCLDENNSKLNESYLDSLLNSVINTVPSSDKTYKKRKVNSETMTKEKETDFNGSADEQNKLDQNILESNTDFESDTKEPDDTNAYLEDVNPYSVDFEDMRDFDRFNINEDLEDQIVISDEELFGENLDELLSAPAVKQPIEKDDHINEEELPLEDPIQQLFIQEPEEDLNIEAEELNQEYEAVLEPQEHSDDYMTIADSDSATTDGLTEEELMDGNKPDSIHNNVNPNEISDFDSEDEMDPSLNDLLNELDLTGIHNDDTEIANEEPELPYLEPANKSNEVTEDSDSEQAKSADDDIMSLLNQISSDDPVSADVQAISELLSGTAVQKQENKGLPGNVGEVFSDALKAVSSLNDPDNLDYDSAEDGLKKSESKDKKKAKVKKEKNKKEKNPKEKNTKKQSKSKKNNSNGEEAETIKKGFWKRLFGNIEDEESANTDSPNRKSSTEESAAAKESTGKGKKKPAKGKKAASKAKGKEDLSENEGSENDKLPDKNQKKKDKKDKKEKKKKDQEIMQVIDEIDEDEGRINRVGASIVFLFFGLLVTLLLIGTNIFSYSLSIHNATNYFDRSKYTEAYNEVYGMDIKDEDIEIYDKIRTVMYVNKQLNSYNYYNALNQYPQALDSLLKGLSRYEKYIELATMLGIETDLNYVREQILAELKNVFGLSEKEAMKIISNDNQAEYSVKVYDIVLENMNN